MWLQEKSIFKQTEKLKTPFYIYDLDGLRERAVAFKAAVGPQTQIHFAMKSNHNPEVLKVFLELGFGVDVVSGGEMRWALNHGFHASQIVFSGVGKTSDELRDGIGLGVAQINVESLGELKRIQKIAGDLGKKVKIAVRINPDVQADTHPHIRTGYRDNKFGIDIQDLPQVFSELKKSPQVELTGLSIHIGSQILDMHSFELAISKAEEVHKDLIKDGFELSTFDIGGGIGIFYDREDQTDEMLILKKYGNLVNAVAQRTNMRVLLEPGRFLVARCGALITEIQYVKKTSHRNFLIVDTGMHHLMRPALYEAFHRIVPLEPQDSKKLELSSSAKELFDVVGPICESTDVLGRDRVFSEPDQGDRLAILDAGAYGSVMSNDYNLNPKAKEYCVKNGQLIS